MPSRLSDARAHELRVIWRDTDVGVPQNVLKKKSTDKQHFKTTT